MKKLCLAVLIDGRVSDTLVKIPVDTDPDDIKEALTYAVDRYFDQEDDDE